MLDNLLRVGHHAAVSLALDDERTVRSHRCDQCGRSYEQVVAFVFRDEDAHAVFHAQCHSHDDGSAPTAWLDIALGSWEGPDFPDHVTFSVRVDANGAGIVDAPVGIEAKAALYGRKLQRDEALRDPRLDDVWDLVDFIVTTDPTVRLFVYGR